MKKLIFIFALLAATSAADAQVVKNLYPAESSWAFSDKGAADYDKAVKLIESKDGNLTEEEWEYVAKLGYDEMYESYWDMIGMGDGWYCGTGAPTNITASSRLASQGSNNYSEKNMHDFKCNTPWVEGVKGYGIGEWVEYTFEANSSRITEIKVVNGYNKSEAAWKNNSRVKTLKVYKNGKPFAILNLRDDRSIQVFEVEPLTDTKVWTMRFEIVDVYKGDKWDDTAISEIYFDGLDVLCFAPGTKVMLADGS
ncbi:MAG: hypothetical protein K6F33_09845, partial [Bacteroidales bacterium]|nr:hypothetical protein [Bacteroidales bacterium]